MHGHTNIKCSDTDCLKRHLIDHDWRCTISYVTNHNVSLAIYHMAAPDIDHAITPAADHDSKTRLSYQFPPYSSCWLPFKVRTPYVLFALSRFAKLAERTDGAVTCGLSPAYLTRTVSFWQEAHWRLCLVCLLTLPDSSSRKKPDIFIVGDGLIRRL